MYLHLTHTQLCIQIEVPLISVLVVCLHTAVHIPAWGAIKQCTVTVQAVPAQPGHGAVLPHVAPGLHVLLLTP